VTKIKKEIIPPEILECLKKDVEKQKLELNIINSNVTSASQNLQTFSISSIPNSNLDIVILNKNCSGKKDQKTQDNKITESLSDSFRPKKLKNDLSKHKLSDAMLNILNADIVRNKGIRLEGDCAISNSTRIQKLQPIESLFDLKIDDDENDLKTNSCNKTKYNITIVYVREKDNITCNETEYPPKPKYNDTLKLPCIGNACGQEVLKKLFIREMLETKKLKHKLVKMYLERKRLKIQNEEKNKLFGESSKNQPPIFNQSDFEK